MEGFESQAMGVGPLSSGRSFALGWQKGSSQKQYPPRQESLLPEGQEMQIMSQISEKVLLQSFIHP